MKETTEQLRLLTRATLEEASAGAKTCLDRDWPFTHRLAEAALKLSDALKMLHERVSRLESAARST